VYAVVTIILLYPVKNRDQPAKCALCSGNQPANYKGCPIFKNHQNQINKLQPQQKSKTSIKEITYPKLVLELNFLSTDT